MKMEEKFKDSALSPKERAEDLLPRLTLREKVGSGGIRSFTAFRATPATASTWSLRTALKKKWKNGAASVCFTAYTAQTRGRTRIIRPPYRRERNPRL